MWLRLRRNQKSAETMSCIKSMQPAPNSGDTARTLQNFAVLGITSILNMTVNLKCQIHDLSSDAVMSLATLHCRDAENKEAVSIQPCMCRTPSSRQTIPGAS